jgi:isopentenyl diphosphate isomerase/L-lactate dehydrogenase-like FMN-dependent dehydrogenase
LGTRYPVAAVYHEDADLDQRRYVRAQIEIISIRVRALNRNATVLTAEDTLLAVKYGVDGVVVSNHGGRQLDGVPATLDALPECVEAAAGRIPVHVDGGFRKGSDIFKALALGADCCWVGRVAIWGLAVSFLALGNAPPQRIQADYRSIV